MYKSSLSVNNKTFNYFSIPEFEQKKGVSVKNLPFSLKVLLENLLRYFDNDTVQEKHLDALVDWTKTKSSKSEINYRPARVLMQDFTGVPAVVDLAAMRDAVAKLGGDPKKINPLSPVDLVIDHSVQVDKYANLTAFKENVDLEMTRNNERYEFLRWGQSSFDNFKVVPPGTGICHQVNLEYIAQCVWQKTENGETVAYPDTLVGTDSHTTMVNGMGVLGWGVGGIEAEAAMLGQPVSMLIPEVIGFKLSGQLNEGITATDLVLRVTQMLRERGVVGKFVEFFGPGLDELPLADRATIANMAPEYGATCGFFPIDEKTIDYLKLTSRSEETIELVESYCKAQGMWRDASTPDPEFTDVLSLDLSEVQPALAGPKRPQDRVNLSDIRTASTQVLADNNQSAGNGVQVPGENYTLDHGDLVIAAITSCTNTSNPSVLMAAGLVAKKAIEKGLMTKPWVKTSLAPGSKVVTEYLEKAGLQRYLDEVGFNLVGYGCTTCIGNSGPLRDEINQAITDNNLVVSSVLSGNRNFEGRVHPLVKANWLASPPLVVAFALAGTTLIDMTKDPIGQDQDGKDVFLKDIWPSNAEVASEVAKLSREMFGEQYADVFSGDKAWQAIDIAEGDTYTWQQDSTYIQNPPFFEGLSHELPETKDIQSAYILAKLGDSVTTDHISPAGNIKADSPAGEYLKANGIDAKDFNSYGSRRGNHEIMMRGTFANIRIRNEMLDNVEGGYTRHIPSGEQQSIYDAAMRYQDEGHDLVVIGGKEYGTGSSRDWAAKGTRLLGVKAVITESFERIHRSNLIGMGVLPLQFTNSETRDSLKLTGAEQISITGIGQLSPQGTLNCSIKYQDGAEKTISLLCRIDTANELTYYRNGGILHYVLRKLMK